MIKKLLFLLFLLTFNVIYSQQLAIAAAITSPITCNQYGSITVTASGGTPSYIYSIDGSTFQTSNIFMISYAGTYTITVKDSLNNTANTSVTFSPTPPIAAYAYTNSLTCYGDSSGTITIITTGGTPPYAYSLTSPIAIGPQASNIFAGLSAGTYTVNVRDASGCMYNSTVIITSPVAPLSSTLSLINTNSILAITAGGTSPYRYSLDNQSLQTSNTFSNVPPGIHTVTTIDANSCMTVSNIEMPTPAIILSTNDHFITSNDLTGEQNVGNILYNDTFNGIQANTSNVSVTVITPALPKFTGAPFPYLNNQGVVLLPEGTPPGKYIIDYKICALNDATNCSSATAKINVTSKQIDAPLGNTIQEFVEGDTLENLVVIGENISWYSLDITGRIADSNVIPLPLNTPLEDGKTYYASQTINDIEGYYRLPVTTTKTLSVKDLIFNNLKAYPNPVKSIFTIQNASLIEKIEVLNNLGQHIFILEPNEFKSDVDVTKLSNGLYFVKITSSNKEKIIKIIKE